MPEKDTHIGPYELDTVVHGDCVELMRELPDGCVDAVVTDPPYGLSFMNKGWDHAVPGVDVWQEALRVLKPGGWLLAFAGTRTQHRMAVNIEDAGFEIRDLIAWLYGSGFPKSLDVSKAIDRQRHDRDQVLQVTAWIRSARDSAGIKNADIDEAFGFVGMARHWTSTNSQPRVPTLDQIPKLLEVLGDPDVPEEIRELIIDLNGMKGQPGEAWFQREAVGVKTVPNAGQRPVSIAAQGLERSEKREITITAPATAGAQKWEGWATALKPAMEPVTVARKPFTGPVAANVLEHGTGALNIDGCRIGTDGGTRTVSDGQNKSKNCYGDGLDCGPNGHIEETGEGRWPANVVHDGSDEAVRSFPDTEPATKRSERGDGAGVVTSFNCSKGIRGHADDGGSAARFFYCAKASKAEREAGLNGMPEHNGGSYEFRQDGSLDGKIPTGRRNVHPTVKPIDLMRWLVRLVTPPDGVVLDPFAGSGSTLIAAWQEGFRGLGFDLSEEYVTISNARIKHYKRVGVQDGLALEAVA